MTNIAKIAVCASALLAGCTMDVTNPSVIDATKFNPATNGQTLALSAQTNFYIAFQDVTLFGGLISEEAWTGALRLETNRTSARTFVGTDDINVDFFAPLSLALVSNIQAAEVLKKGAQAATDINLATASMNAGYSFVLEAETMCASAISEGPQVSDVQLLDSAVVRFKDAITVANAAGASSIVAQSNVGLARAYLQLHDYANAASTAALVPAGFQANVITTANSATLATLGNLIFATQIGNQFIVPARYRNLNDSRVKVQPNPGTATNPNVGLFDQLKYTGYDTPYRLASTLEAQFIGAEAKLHQGNTAPALALIAAERAGQAQDTASFGTDTLSVLGALLNERAREFWLEAKKLGDLRRNPSVPLDSVLTDKAGTAFYGVGGGNFGSTFCAPIPPEETSANPNF